MVKGEEFKRKKKEKRKVYGKERGREALEDC